MKAPQVMFFAVSKSPMFFDATVTWSMLALEQTSVNGSPSPITEMLFWILALSPHASWVGCSRVVGVVVLKTLNVALTPLVWPATTLRAPGVEGPNVVE
jgi:hypothetical protein